MHCLSLPKNKIGISTNIQVPIFFHQHCTNHQCTPVFYVYRKNAGSLSFRRKIACCSCCRKFECIVIFCQNFAALPLWPTGRRDVIKPGLELVGSQASTLFCQPALTRNPHSGSRAWNYDKKSKIWHNSRLNCKKMAAYGGLLIVLFFFS